MGELLDFKDRGNFEFFKFSSYYGDNKQFQSSLKSKCEHVLEYAHATVQDMCLLGYNLKELKESGKWQWVRNPKNAGICFQGDQFADFCYYAFGFSETKTSDLLRISKFVKISGTKTGFLRERFQSYNTSQLVELASVADDQIHYFNPQMTVKEMRIVKRYLDKCDYEEEQRNARQAGEDFDVLEYAKAWQEKEDNKKSGKVQPLNEVLDGQITLEELEEVEETPEENPTSDLANSCEADESDEIERAREAARQAGIPFSDKPFEGPDDDFNPHVYDGSMSVADYKRMQEEIAEDDEDYAEPPEGGYYQGGGLDLDDEDDESEEETPEENPTSDLAETRTEEKPRYNLKTRAGVREFLTDSEKWAGRSGYWWFQPACCYTFRNGAMLYALKYTSITDVNTFHRKDCVLYFIEHQGAVSEITKEQFEQYCALHKDEL